MEIIHLSLILIIGKTALSSCHRVAVIMKVGGQEQEIVIAQKPQQQEAVIRLAAMDLLVVI